MTGLVFPILIALAVAAAVFGLTQVATSIFADERRKLKHRLVGDSRAEASSKITRPITLQDQQPVGLGVVLSKFTFFESLRKTLLQAYPDVRFERFMAVCVGMGFGAFSVAFVASNSWLVGGGCGLAGLYAPIVMANMRRNKRQRMLAIQLPEALDFLSRILRAGHSLSTGLQMMADELPAPLAGEFRRAYDQHSLGQPMDDALKDMATRVESTDFAFFVTAVLIQRQTGGDLSEVLSNISGMIRQRIRLQMQVKAKTAEGRFTGYFLAGFPLIMFMITYMMDPDRTGLLITDKTGMWLSGTAVGFQLIGLFFIKRITTVVV